MTRARASVVLQVAAVVLLLSAVGMFVAARRARKVEQGVVGDAESTVMRERFRNDGSDQ